MRGDFGGGLTPPHNLTQFFQFSHFESIIDMKQSKKQLKKATIKTKVVIDGKTGIIEVALFQPTGHTQYSGFGVHQKSNRKSERKRNRQEARNVMRGEF